jgi:hypothetical protein
MKQFCVNAPINSVSFGQVTTSVLLEMLDRGIEPNIFPIGGKIDLSAQEVEQEKVSKLEELATNSPSRHRKGDPSFKLWHFNGSLESFSKEQLLLTFYETDSPTKEELNCFNSNRVLLTSKYAMEIFEEKGVKPEYLPLFFDHLNFEVKKREYFTDDRIVFNLCGKFEKRKRHPEILDAWARKYGNNTKYFLQCAIFNPFLSPEVNDKLISESLRGARYNNIQVLRPMSKNSLYNDFLNSANIVIGMSGGEGWGLPEFHSIGLGKHSVMLNAHSYKDFITEENSVLVEPSGKVDSDDGLFFKKGEIFNQGQFFKWDEDDFIDGCEEAIKRVESNVVNEAGLKLQDDFPLSQTVDTILKKIEEM